MDNLQDIPHSIWVGLAGLLGLLIGSFLNVVIYRLPQIMQAQWDAQCQALLAMHQADKQADTATDVAAAATLTTPAQPSLSLSYPGSHCPHCQHRIGWLENIPLLSWLVLRGRCRHCQAAIAWRYPLVELCTAALFAGCIAHWGMQPQGWAWCGFTATLLTLALIDWDTTLLPDSLTLPLLWAGLLAAALGITALPLSDAFWGAVGGYLSLWLVYWVFKLATGKEGMGYGDFKLLGALGAWLGWQALVPIVLLSSVVGVVVGLAMKWRGQLRSGGYLPFGPFLAAAGFLVMAWGAPAVMHGIWTLLGMQP